MTIDFSNLDKLRVDPNVVQPFVFIKIWLTDKPVRLFSKVASVDYNDDYRNEIVRRSAERTTKLNPDDPNLLGEARKNDIGIMARTCVTGWEEVIDSDGSVVEFSPEACEEFFLAIPEDIFDDYRVWAITLDNFRRRAISGVELGNALPIV